jgi:hypothetical protein
MSDTTKIPDHAISNTWPLNQVLLLLISLFFLGLMIDLRGEHIDVVTKHWTAWIPIYYSGIMVFSGVITLVQWKPTTLRIFYWFSTVGIVVGVMGFWFHNSGHIFENMIYVFQAWYKPLDHMDDAPVLAPLAISGLGLLGMIASATRFQQRA